MDFSFYPDDLNFSSVEQLPGLEARAAFTVNSQSVFQDTDYHRSNRVRRPPPCHRQMLQCRGALWSSSSPTCKKARSTADVWPISSTTYAAARPIFPNGAAPIPPDCSRHLSSITTKNLPANSFNSPKICNFAIWEQS